MNNYRFTQNEFERRAQYWGCGSRAPQRHELFTPVRRDENKYRHTKPNEFYENLRQRMGYKESYPMSISPSFDKRSRNKLRSNYSRKEKILSPSGTSFNNNRKCGPKLNQSLLVNIDTRNCHPRRVSLGCESIRNSYNNTFSGKRSCGVHNNCDTRRARSLTPAGIDCRPKRANCPRKSCRMEVAKACCDWPFKKPNPYPFQRPAVRPIIHSPKRNLRRQLDYKHECVCFNNKAWSCSHIAQLKTFLSTANCNEVMALMGVVRCLIRERYSTNNSNCVRSYKSNNAMIDYWEDMYEQPPKGDISYCKQFSTNSDDICQPVISQNTKSVSFDQKSKQSKHITSTPGKTKKPTNQMTFDKDVVISSKHYNSPVDLEKNNFTQPGSSEKRYLRNKSHSSPVVDVDTILKKSQKGENQLRPQRSWSGVITDYKSFLKNSTESRHQAKLDIESKIHDAWKMKTKEPNEKPDEEDFCSYDFIKKDRGFSHLAMPIETHSCDTQHYPLGDEKGNKYYLSKKAYDQLCQFIDPAELASRQNHKSSKFTINRLNDYGKGVNSSSYSFLNEDENNDKNDDNNSSTDSFIDRDKQDKGNVCQHVPQKTLDSSSIKINDNSKTGGGDNVPKELLDITKSTQVLLNKVSVRIKEVEKLWDVTEHDVMGYADHNNGQNEVTDPDGGVKLPCDNVDDTTFTINLHDINETNSTVGQSVADNILSEDDECVLDLKAYEIFKKEVTNISKQIEEDTNHVQTERSLKGRNGRGLLIRENTWVKSDSKETKFDVDSETQGLTRKDESIVSICNSMTSLDTNSSLTEVGNNSNVEENLEGGCDEEFDDSTVPIISKQLSKIDLKNLKTHLKSTPVVFKMYGSSSPLPKETQVHLQSCEML